MARKPLVASGTSVPDRRLTTRLPSLCRTFFIAEKSLCPSMSLHPTTTSAFLSRTGLTSLTMSAPLYWLSPSVFTMMSAPRKSAASRPFPKALVSPMFLLFFTMKSTPSSSATSMVLSVLPSSIMRVYISSTPSILLGRSAITAGSEFSSLRQGTCMKSLVFFIFPGSTFFMTGLLAKCSRQKPKRLPRIL